MRDMNLFNEKTKELHNPVITKDKVVYDCIYFGSYPQSDATGQMKEPIKWRVLSINGDDAFLVADRNLDVKYYNDRSADVTWETCTMRSWLNGYRSDSNICGKDYSSDNFINRAFTTSEQSAIKTSTVVNADNSYNNTEGCGNTQDKVFLLSYDEVTDVDYGFSSDYCLLDSARKRKNTAYVAKGGTIGSNYMYSEGSTEVWLLRSPGGYSYLAMCVIYDGTVGRCGNDVCRGIGAVCPALHLCLKSNCWSYAGKIKLKRNL